MCKKCASANDAHVEACASCGCPAVIAPATLEPPKKQTEKPDHFLKESGSWFMLFPELPIAVLLLLSAPVWAVSLLLKGHAFPAFFLLIGAGGLGYGAYRAIRANERWGTYASIIGILIIGGIVASAT